MESFKLLRVIFLEDILFSKDWMLIHIINQMHQYMDLNDVITYKMKILDRYESDSLNIDLNDDIDGGFKITDSITSKEITKQTEFVKRQSTSILTDIFGELFKKYPNLFFSFIVDINPNMSMIHTDLSTLLVYDDSIWEESKYIKGMIFPNVYHKMDFISKEDFWKIFAKHVVPPKQGLKMTIFSPKPINDFLSGLDKYILPEQRELIEVDMNLIQESYENIEYFKSLEDKIKNNERVLTTGVVNLWDPQLIHEFSKRNLYKNIK